MPSINVSHVHHSNTFLPKKHEHLEGHDVFIDMQYANDEHKNPVEFAEAPSDFSKNYASTYFGLRFGKRDEYIRELVKKSEQPVRRPENDESFKASHGLETIERAKRKIISTRRKFAETEKGNRIMKELDQERLAWRAAVSNQNHEDYGHMVGRHHSGRENSPIWNRNLSLDAALFKRVIAADFQEEDDMERDLQGNVTADIDVVEPAEYGYKASVIYFKKSDLTKDTWDPDTCFHRKFINSSKFPNQKVYVHNLIGDSQDNPLSEPCKAGQLRYCRGTRSFPSQEGI